VACIKNQFKIVDLLINYGGDLEARDREGKKPLYYAIKAKNIEIVKVYIIFIA
jgi:ankyrin repeat protein